MKIEGREVSCVLRTYRVGDTGLPDSIVVKGEEILAAPAVFELAVGGSLTEVKPLGSVKFGKTIDAGTSWQARASGGGVTIASDVKFEFDGMAHYELTVAPASGPSTVDRLALAIPLKAQHGDKIHALPLGGNFRDYEVSWQLSAKDGVIWESKTGFPRGAHKPTVGSFAPMVWLGGLVRGLCYFADSDRGWVPSDKHPAITVTRDKERHHAPPALHRRALYAGQAAEDRLRLAANTDQTAAAELPRLGPWRHQNYPLVGGRIMSCDSFAQWKTNPREQAFDIFPKDYDFQFAARCAKSSGDRAENTPPDNPC